eukprot:4083823-Alexandrium_andersonii.AAC.1
MAKAELLRLDAPEGPAEALLYAAGRSTDGSIGDQARPQSFCGVARFGICTALSGSNNLLPSRNVAATALEEELPSDAPVVLCLSTQLGGVQAKQKAQAPHLLLARLPSLRVDGRHAPQLLPRLREAEQAKGAG